MSTQMNMWFSFMTAHQPITILPLWYRFMQTYILRCLNNEEIEGKLQNMTLQYTVIEQYEISFSLVDCYYYTHVCQFTLMIDHFE